MLIHFPPGISSPAIGLFDYSRESGYSWMFFSKGQPEFPLYNGCQQTANGQSPAKPAAWNGQAGLQCRLRKLVIDFGLGKLYSISVQRHLALIAGGRATPEPPAKQIR